MCVYIYLFSPFEAGIAGAQHEWVLEARRTPSRRQIKLEPSTKSSDGTVLVQPVLQECLIVHILVRRPFACEYNLHVRLRSCTHHRELGAQIEEVDSEALAGRLGIGCEYATRRQGQRVLR